jgi:formylmethanofuran dehydrogenase subunit A
MTTDHPNGGPFMYYPKVIAWLMSRKARTDTMNESNKACIRKTTLANIYREYTFNEIVIVTRAATAKALGLDDKGHLGKGADADVAIYDIDPSTWKPSQYDELEKSFAKAAYTIKDGKIVAKDGEIIASPMGTIHWVNAAIPEEIESDLMKELEADFKDYYTVSLKNYPVEDVYLPIQKEHLLKEEW